MTYICFWKNDYKEEKDMKKMYRVFVLVLALMISMAGCVQKVEESQVSDAQDTSESDVIKIGVFQPLTGANAAGGEMELEGTKLANEMFPEVLGKKIELVIVDNKSDRVEAGNAVARLVERDKVSAVIGSWGSGFSMAAGETLKNAGIPAVAPSATNPLVTLDNDYYFRVCFIDTFQGKVLAQLAYEELGAKKVAIIQEVNNDYSVGLAQFFSNEFKDLTSDDGSIVEVANYNTGDQDFTAQLTNIKAKNPDVIFAPGNFTESALIMKQAKELGIDVPFLGGDTWETPEFIEVGQDAVEGAMLTTFFATEVPLNDLSKEFIEKYREKFNREPSAVAALGFDAYLVIRDAIERAGDPNDTAKIKDEIAKTNNFQGATGSITLDENGDAIKDVIIKTVENRNFVYKTTVKHD